MNAAATHVTLTLDIVFTRAPEWAIPNSGHMRHHFGIRSRISRAAAGLIGGVCLPPQVDDVRAAGRSPDFAMKLRREPRRVSP